MSAPRAAGGNGSSQATDHLREQVPALVRDYPASSAMIALGVGCMAGLAVAWMMMPQRRRPHWYEFQTPEWASRRQLERAFEKVPRTVAKYLGGNGS